ncbi:MAG TPA: peptidase M20, partial [Phenylobacterium sp.]|nr:peptidase M20 [Phenylobacterium sp.]
MPKAAVLALALAGLSSQALAAADPARLSQIVRTMASDEFQGRAPGSLGEQKTVDYLVAQFRALGLEPAGEKGGFVQEVPLLRTQIATPGT